MASSSTSTPLRVGMEISDIEIRMPQHSGYGVNEWADWMTVIYMDFLQEYTEMDIYMEIGMETVATPFGHQRTSYFTT